MIMAIEHGQVQHIYYTCTCDCRYYYSLGRTKLVNTLYYIIYVVVVIVD